MVTDPAVTVVSESGITARAEMIKLREHGVHAALVGEALIREPDIGAKVRELLGQNPAGPALPRGLGL
jgi:indole-3-glycerol phosphate synthase